MMLFSRKQMIARAVGAGVLAAAASVAVGPVRAADDLPMVGDIQIQMPRVLDDEGASPPPVYESVPYESPYAQRPYRPGSYAPGPYAAIPSGRYERSALDARPVLPPVQVVHVLRSSGYSLLGPVTQRGWIYTVAALDRNGDDGRLIVDARTGRIMRFIPAMEVDARLNDRMAMAYGPPGPPPSAEVRYDTRRGSLLDLRRAPRPAVAVPKVVQRAAPKVASRASPSAPIPAARPVTAPAQQAVPAQTSTPEPAKAAETAPATTVGMAKPASAVVIQPAMPSGQPPAAAHIQPTQEMPPVQELN